eukprot:CAMPEP_0119531930 /NCGR_PEP_ID=MMETSP1344-20130328/45544_1 /TAXON_ID=236787 /ORGANISM="Florenciella parvula, Strain CCMP2471" /LENGTH=105 /DNA_ID=CAMNT_0007572305 /DNA_START=146 /DNA_END=463 /DNA_ORIENTATION=-
MVTRSKGHHLVPVHRVEIKETLHLLRHHSRTQMGPYIHQFPKHSHWAAPRELAKAAEVAELVVRHAHVLLVSLRLLPVIGPQLCRRWRTLDLKERRIAILRRAPF